MVDGRTTPHKEERAYEAFVYKVYDRHEGNVTPGFNTKLMIDNIHDAQKARWMIRMTCQLKTKLIGPDEEKRVSADAMYIELVSYLAT